MSGIRLAALCGFYPHKFGFCGTQESLAKKTLSSYLAREKISEQKIRKILETFKGAFAYYKLIAKSNGIKDPFNEKVVKAYWIGNKLLDKVPVASLREMIVKDFSGPGLLSKKTAKRKAGELPSASRAHHSFHVMVLGSVTGRIKLEGKLLDICRISLGKVVGFKEGEKRGLSRAVIEYQPLLQKNGKYSLSRARRKIVFWEKKFLPEVKKGSIVAIHWNHIAQLLKDQEAALLEKYTQITLDSLNNQNQ